MKISELISFKLLCIIAFIVILIDSNYRISFADSTPPDSGQQIVDDADPGWVWNGMDNLTDPSFHGGAAHAGGPGTYGAYTFHGIGVDIYGFSSPAVTVDGRVHRIGSIAVSIDGKRVDLASEKNTETDYGYLVARINDLADGNHVLQVAPDGGWGVVDYLVVHKAVDAAGTSTSTLSATASTPSAIPAGDYRLIPRSAPDKYLDLTDPSGQNGAQLQIYDQVDGHAETWHISPLGDNHYRISPANAPNQSISMPVLTPQLDDPTIVVWQYSGDARQQVIITPVADGFYKIASAATPSEVLNVFYNLTSNGTKIIGYKWTDGAQNEMWWLQRIGKR